MSGFKFSNTDQTPPSELPIDFTITAPPGTDIWKKPPSTNAFNAPILHHTIPVSSFAKARVAVTADWKHLYDQGGLILVLPQADGSKKWIKTGIEFVDGKAMISTVVTDRYADWSLQPLPQAGGNSVTVEMERAGVSLWVYVIQGVERRPIRKVAWVFEEGNVKGECWVGAYAAKPSQEGGDLEVTFGHLVVEDENGRM